MALTLPPPLLAGSVTHECPPISLIKGCGHPFVSKHPALRSPRPRQLALIWDWAESVGMTGGDNDDFRYQKRTQVFGAADGRPPPRLIVFRRPRSLFISFAEFVVIVGGRGLILVNGCYTVEVDSSWSQSSLAFENWQEVVLLRGWVVAEYHSLPLSIASLLTSSISCNGTKLRTESDAGRGFKLVVTEGAAHIVAPPSYRTFRVLEPPSPPPPSSTELIGPHDVPARYGPVAVDRVQLSYVPVYRHPTHMWRQTLL